MPPWGIMSTLYQTLLGRQSYSANPEISLEPTARLPYALFGPAIITHFPLFFGSQEHRNFDARRKRAYELVVEPLRNPPAAIVAEYPKGVNRLIVEEAIKIAWAASWEKLRLIEQNQPELLVFGAITLISLEINRGTHDKIVKSTAPAWQNPILKTCAFEITNAVVLAFLEALTVELDKFADVELDKGYSSEASEDSSNEPLFPTPQEGLGGLISLFDASDGLEAHGIAETKMGTRRVYALDGLDCLHFKNKREPVIDKYLVWRRGDRNWRYTFCEGIFKYENDPKAECGADVRNFVWRLLSSSGLKNSFPRAPITEKTSGGKDYPLPGLRIAGAQYFVIPAELLILIAKHLQALSTSMSLKLDFTTEFRLTHGSTIASAIDDLCRFDKAQLDGGEGLRSLIASSSPNVDELVHDARKIKARLDALYSRVIGFRIKSAELSEESERFYQGFAALAELLWKYVYCEEKYRIGQDDFVSSVVIDGRAMYFSNFRPYDSDETGFTRTFFIDFGLVPYQRGRLVRRLCEIATYRMSCVKDMALFTAMQDGINQLNGKFSEVALAATQGWEQDKDRIQNDLMRAVLVYRRAMQFDTYVTEGVLAARRGAEGDWQRVRRQVTDIRERRLTGYARLSDFLERGLAVSVLEIGKVADRYETLTVRIRDLMSTIRTELSKFRTELAGEQQREVGKTVKQIADAGQQQVIQIADAGRKQQVFVISSLLLNCAGAVSAATIAASSPNVPGWFVVAAISAALVYVTATLGFMWYRYDKPSRQNGAPGKTP